jgi:hypothetical protein
MGTARTVTATVLLAVEAGLGALGVLVHYGFIAEYGDVTGSMLEGFGSGFTSGVGVIALVLVGATGLIALSVSLRPWMRWSAVALPVLMVLGMLAVTPAALRHKLDVQYDATPQCVSREDMGPGPGTDAERESQKAFDSIDHVGHFGGGGSSGVGGCSRSYVLTEDVDVLRHYRGALPDAGWRVTEDGADRLRAERAGMAFEVVTCGSRDGVVWAGSVDDARHGATCESPEIAG